MDKSSQLQQPKTWLGKVPNYYETNLWAVPRSEATRVCKSKHQNQYFQHQHSFGNRRRNVSIISKPTIPSQFCTDLTRRCTVIAHLTPNNLRPPQAESQEISRHPFRILRASEIPNQIERPQQARATRSQQSRFTLEIQLTPMLL